MPCRRHPAFLAWKLAHPESSCPDTIEILTRKNNKPLVGGTLIYRLKGAGFGSSAVIAKKGPVDGLFNEKRIYEKVLPFLPLASLSSYGFVADSDSEFAWLFLEEAPGTRYSEEKKSDRLLVANWLGAFHSTTSRIDDDFQLKEYGTDLYLRRLESGLDSLKFKQKWSFLGENDKKDLERLFAIFKTISFNWSKIEEICNQMPRCIVHRDFIAKNVWINASDEGLKIAVIDWEVAGWGVPAEDLGALDFTYGCFSGLDVGAYHKASKKYWPEVNESMIEEWINFGVLLRHLSWISKTAELLRPDWFEKPMNDMKQYQTSLTLALERMRWN